jgi:hypothetical protein
LVFLHLYLTGYLIHHIGSGDSRAPEADSLHLSRGAANTGHRDKPPSSYKGNKKDAQPSACFSFSWFKNIFYQLFLFLFGI